MRARHAVRLDEHMPAVVYQRTQNQVKIEVDAIKRAGDQINKSAATARAFLRKHGFITKDNKLTKRYR